MNKLILSALYLLCALQLCAQTEGISYQAVIIGPDKQELPGVDAVGNILPNASIAVRFSIIDGTNALVYQEVQTTKTDQYGRVNLLIGKADPDKFALIDWDGTAKDLKVEINFNGSGFVDMSREELTFIPYSYHRNVTARGNLVVDGTSDLNGELKVGGPTNLNSTLNVNDSNATNLSGSLDVGGHASLKNGLTVEGTTRLDSLDISGNLKVVGQSRFEGPAVFEGDVDFTSPEPANFNSISIDSTATFKGGLDVVTTRSSTPADQKVFEDYPLKVSGSEQGIAIKVNGDRTTNNNFISFWDESGDSTQGTMWGRIEGQTISELNLDYQYERGRVKNVLDVAKAVTTASIAYLDVFQAGFKTVAASTSSTACVGVGACVTVPIPSLIVESISNTALRIANAAVITYDLASTIENAANYEVVAHKNIGVTYSSGSGDYAEWLPKENITDDFTEGELVGVKNGLVSKDVWGGEKIMIVSTRPIVLGNMPQQNDEKNNVKIAFMGQVPVKVLGQVTPGDYILPNIFGNSFARAVHPEDMKPIDYNRIAGVAWNVITEMSGGLSIVNTAVGINTNDLSDVVARQEEEIKDLKAAYNQLKDQIGQSNRVLSGLVPGYAAATGLIPDPTVLRSRKPINDQHQKLNEKQLVNNTNDDIIFFEISREQIEHGLSLARELYIEMYNDSKLAAKLATGSEPQLRRRPDNSTLIPIEKHPFWEKIDSDPSYKNEIIRLMQNEMEKAYHTHKKYANNFSSLKIRN